jgi:transcriptional regulator with XRE-family HTH domain
MRFADRLRALREEADMTQAELAEASRLPLDSIRDYEQGQRAPSWQVIFKLADALGVSCEAFKDRVDVGRTEPPAKKGKPQK